MSFTKEAAIIAQNSATAAAAIVAALVVQQGLTDVGEVNSIFDLVRTNIFNGSIALAGAESVVELMEATPATRGGSQRRTGGGSRTDYSDQQPGDVVIKGGKHAGKTIADVADEDPEWIEWAATNLNNDFLRKKVVAFQAA